MDLINWPYPQQTHLIEKLITRRTVEADKQHALNKMDTQIDKLDLQANSSWFNTKERSDGLMNYFLIVYFMIGLILAPFYGTWLIALVLGGGSVLLYYAVKSAFPNSDLYQYVLSAVLGIYMAQFIYQMHGMSEMHFFAFIGSALLITYQKWTLQLPLVIVILIHHIVFGYLENVGYSRIYFTELNNFDLRTFMIHTILGGIIFFICGLWSFQLKKHSAIGLSQALKMAELQKRSQLSQQRKKHGEERSIILESIGDAFFAVDRNWTVTYWNNMAEKVLRTSKADILNKNLWEVFPAAIDSASYDKYHEALYTNEPVHFEDHYVPLNKWYEVSAYPSAKGLSVYFKDISERKESELQLRSSEKKYSELFELSPIPMWVFDLDTLQFLDVNAAALKNYGYSREEFLSMNLKDIRPEEDISIMEENIAKFKADPDHVIHGIYRHKRKNGEIIQADIQSYSIRYKDKLAKVILANDVTERLNYINAIEGQNQKLRDISWMQSHIIRAPLARIMGLIPLIENFATDEEEKDKMLQYMLMSAHELDNVIRDITEKTMVD